MVVFKLYFTINKIIEKSHSWLTVILPMESYFLYVCKANGSLGCWSHKKTEEVNADNLTASVAWGTNPLSQYWLALKWGHYRENMCHLSASYRWTKYQEEQERPLGHSEEMKMLFAQSVTTEIFLEQSLISYKLFLINVFPRLSLGSF